MSVLLAPGCVSLGSVLNLSEPWDLRSLHGANYSRLRIGHHTLLKALLLKAKV